MIDEREKDIYFYQDEDYCCTFYDEQEYKKFVDKRRSELSEEKLEFVELTENIGNIGCGAGYDIRD